MKRFRQSLPATVARKMFIRYFEDHVAMSAAELAYYLLFSLFPLLIFINAAISTLHISAAEMLKALDIVVPSEVVQLVSDYMEYIRGLKSNTLLYAGLVLTIYMLFRSLNSLMNSIMNVYRIHQRGTLYYFSVVVFSVVLLLSIVVFLAALMISGKLLTSLGRYIYISPVFIRLWDLLRIFLAPLYMFLMLALFYHIVGRGHYKFRQSLPGAVFSQVIWTAATVGFSYYVTNMGNYSLLYGSIGAIMVLMFWLWLTGIVLILGGVLNHVLAEELELRKKAKS